MGIVLGLFGAVYMYVEKLSMEDFYRQGELKATLWLSSVI